jgi:hypothetical protein
MVRLFGVVLASTVAYTADDDDDGAAGHATRVTGETFLTVAQAAQVYDDELLERRKKKQVSGV